MKDLKYFRKKAQTVGTMHPIEGLHFVMEMIEAIYEILEEVTKIQKEIKDAQI